MEKRRDWTPFFFNFQDLRMIDARQISAASTCVFLVNKCMFAVTRLPLIGQLPIEAHGYYRACGSGHSHLAMRADFQV